MELMLSAGIAILAGSVWACFLPRNIDTFWVSFLPICLYFAYSNRYWRFTWLFIASFLWTSLAIYWQLDHRLSAELNNKRVTLVGEVLNIPKISTGHASFLFKPQSIEGYNGKLPGLVKLYWRDSPHELSAGQIWRLKIKVKKPHGYQNPGGFDYERWLFVKGIDASGYVINTASHRLLGENSFALNHFRQSINYYIQRNCPDCLNLGLIQALAIGYRGNIEHQQRKLLQQTGTAHLIAISGLHIGIIAGAFYLIGFKLWRFWLKRSRLNRHQFALLLSWIAALCYSIASGFDLPAQRAFIMLSVIFVSVWVRIPVNLLNSVFLALILVLLFSPLAVLSESFWLSFCALLVIAFGSLFFSNISSRLHQMVFIQLLFSLLFLPLSIIIFGQLQLASFAANLVAVPFISFVIVPLNFLLITLAWLPHSLLLQLYKLLDELLTWLIDYLQWLQEIGLQAQMMTDLTVWKLIIGSLLIFLLILPRGFISLKSWWIFLPLVIVWPNSFRFESDLNMAVMDVGMGTSIIIQTQNHSLIYDFGPGNDSGFSMGDWVVKPYLQQQGIDKVDVLVLSHSDQDHIGGLYRIAQSIDYNSVSSGTPEQVKQLLPGIGPVRNCHHQPDWEWDGVMFRFLSASGNKIESDNNRSCVLQIQSGQKRILISGDIEASQESKLIEIYADALQADILVAPHHGSLTSSTEHFVEAVNADHVIFTTGYMNRWNFPRAEIVSRYQKKAAEIYQTDRDGAILISCKAGDCGLDRMRQLKPRLWY